MKRCPSYFRRNFFFKRKTSIFDVRALKSRKLDLYTNRSTKENEEDRNRNTESEAKKIERHRQWKKGKTLVNSITSITLINNFLSTIVSCNLPCRRSFWLTKLSQTRHKMLTWKVRERGEGRNYKSKLSSRLIPLRRVSADKLLYTWIFNWPKSRILFMTLLLLEMPQMHHTSPAETKDSTYWIFDHLFGYSRSSPTSAISLVSKQPLTWSISFSDHVIISKRLGVKLSTFIVVERIFITIIIGNSHIWIVSYRDNNHFIVLHKTMN